MPNTLLTLVVMFVALSATWGCGKREDLATRLAKERADFESKTPPSPEEFREAAMRGDVEAMLNAIERGVDVNAVDESDRTALQLACFEGQHEAVELLIERKADINHLDNAGRTPLMFASTGPYIRCVDQLIEAGAAIDPVDNDEHFDALMFAAAEGQLEVVESLLRAGANPNAVDVDGESARDFAANNGHADVVALLDSVIAK